MLSTLSLLAVVALVELSILALLWLRFEKCCLGGYQPRVTITLVPKPDGAFEAAPEGEDLRLDVDHLLYAFELAAAHVKKGGTYLSRLAEQKDIAECLVDWAICESNRGTDLLKELTKPDEIRS